jgi:ABC-2 type transport system permease protein
LFLWVFPETSYFAFGYATSQLFFEFAYYLLIFIIPAVAVGLFSNEFRQGTLETLHVLPVSWRQVLSAKFLIGMLVILLFVILSFPLHSVLGEISQLPYSEGAQITASYIGFIFIGACFLSMSLCVSSFFENSAITFIVAVICNFFLYSGFLLISKLSFWSNDLSFTIQKLGVQYHADYLSRGVIPFSSIVYLLSIVFIFQLLTESRLTQKRF